MVAKSRAPSDKIRKEKAALKETKKAAVLKAKEVEDAQRKAGGFGRNCVSIKDAPPGGILNSPAYKKVLVRCGGKMPLPKDRAGAPVKGGYPLDQYPVNVLVDGQRAPWLPDDWAQVIKNTGPGGSYLGWFSPEGKFFYHKKGYPSAIEETLGKKLTAKDGFNGVCRNVRAIVEPDADKKFLNDCLTPSERKHIPAADKFYFCVISARRANHESGIVDAMTVEGHFYNVGIKPTWYVDAESLQAYKDLGLDAKVGGKLTPSRNLALDDANKLGKFCVQVSDDISKWEYFDVARQDCRGDDMFQKMNQALGGAKSYIMSPLAAAQWMAAKMLASPLKPKLAGVFPTGNAAMTMGADEYSTEHFVLGDFFVHDPSSPCRFDTTMTLKEDYDFTCSHIDKHGSVLRCNRMLLHVKHATNAGGAVAVRDGKGAKERYNIGILQKKWPGAFRLNPKRKDEVILQWSHGTKAKACQGGQTSDQNENLKTKGHQGCSLKLNARPASQIRMKDENPKATIPVKKSNLKPKLAQLAKALPSTGVLRFTGKEAKEKYITDRCRKCDKKKIEECLGTTFVDNSGNERRYGYSDLKYDISGGRLEIAKKVR